MSSELATTETEVQQPVAAMSGGQLNPWVGRAYQTAFVVRNQAKRISKRTWIVGGSFAIAITLYMTQWQKVAPPDEVENPYDSRAIPAFDEAKLMQKDLKEIDGQERNLSAFLNEERQRKTITLALGLRALATFYIQSPSHPCNGRDELGCLATFDANRISDLEALGTGDRQIKGTGFSPLSVLRPTIEQGSAIDLVDALRLAKILSKPASARAAWEQAEIDLRYPLLNAGLPANELTPRPMTLAKLLKQSQESSGRLSSTSQESQALIEYCLSLTPEQQAAKGGCK